MISDRDEIAQLKSQLATVRMRIDLLPIPNARKVQERLDAASGVDEADMHSAGFNPRDPKHRDAWRRRNDDDCGGSF